MRHWVISRFTWRIGNIEQRCKHVWTLLLLLQATRLRLLHKEWKDERMDGREKEIYFLACIWKKKLEWIKYHTIQVLIGCFSSRFPFFFCFQFGLVWLCSELFCSGKFLFFCLSILFLCVQDTTPIHPSRSSFIVCRLQLDIRHLPLFVSPSPLYLFSPMTLYPPPFFFFGLIVQSRTHVYLFLSLFPTYPSFILFILDLFLKWLIEAFGTI